MTGLLRDAFLSALLFGVVTVEVPLLFAGLGEQMAEKAGVLNIGIERMVLAGACLGFVGAYYLGSLCFGFLTGAAGGFAVASLVALLCVRIGLNQIVIGIALTLGLEGLTALLHHFQFARLYPACRPSIRPPFRSCRRARSSGLPSSSTISASISRSRWSPA